MKTGLFDYFLPKKLIAQKPASPRDHCRLLVYKRKQKKIIHDKFYNIINYLRPGDVLVLNNTKVMPARLIGHKETGGKAEVLLLKKQRGFCEALLNINRSKIGLKLRFKQGLKADVIKQISDKIWQIKFNFNGAKFNAILDKIGQAPVPPYIKQGGEAQKRQYQTVFAKYLGSIAAPTAGLHFTKKLIKKLRRKNIQIEYITLHVGLGTFEPVKTENIENFKIHSERASIDTKTLRRLKRAKDNGRRIICVGTTAVRALESAAAAGSFDSNKKFDADIDLFIYPRYKFRAADGLITNFHLPKSSLIMLVSSLIGRKKTLAIYEQAIKKKYRFYSFGDAMLIE